MSDIDQLKESNPAETQPDWGSSVAGRAALASVLDRISDDTELQPAPARTPRPWVYAAAGFAITLAALLPLFWSGRDPGSDPLALPGDPYRSISDDVLDDMFVSDEELEFAAEAVVECTTELSGSSEPSTTYEIEPTGSVSFTTSEGSDGEGIEAFEACYGPIFGGIEMVWARQNQPPPAADFYFYGGVVVCTEQQTGQDYGEMTRDSLGYISTDGQRTINKALDHERDIYMGCFDAMVDQVAFYNEVLACISVHVGEAFKDLEPAFEPDPRDESSRTQVTTEGLATLDRVADEHFEAFTNCQENLAGFLAISPRG